MNLLDYVLKKLRRDEMTIRAGCTISGMLIGDGLLLVLEFIILRVIAPDLFSDTLIIMLPVGGVMIFSLGVLLIYLINKEIPDAPNPPPL